MPTLGRAATLVSQNSSRGDLRPSSAAVQDTADADEVLFVLPIAVLALRFGLRGGLAGAAKIALILAWDLGRGAAASVWLREPGVAFVVLGVLLGIVVDQRRALQTEAMCYFDARSTCSPQRI